VKATRLFQLSIKDQGSLRPACPPFHTGSHLSKTYIHTCNYPPSFPNIQKSRRIERQQISDLHRESPSDVQVLNVQQRVRTFATDEFKKALVGKKDASRVAMAFHLLYGLGAPSRLSRETAHNDRGGCIADGGLKNHHQCICLATSALRLVISNAIAGPLMQA